jgi:hypothetical protein
MSAINENDLMNNQLYQITLATSEEFKVYASDEQEAIDLLISHLVDDEREYAYYNYDAITELCEVGESVSEYVAENNFYQNENGVYIQVKEIKIVKEEF